MVNAVAKYQKYAEYKDSGVKWLGSIPIHWSAFLFKRVVAQVKDGTHGTHARVENGELLLSAKNVFNHGVEIGESESYIPVKDHEEITSNGFPKKGDILVTCVGTIGRSFVYPFDKPLAFQRSVSFLRLNKKGNPQFYKYFIESKAYQSQLESLVKSSAQGGIYMGDLINTVVINCPFEEQGEIANFLDHETAKIDSLIEKQQKLIELFKEKRQAVISHSVTKGLNPNAPMKDSGMEWLGQVPEHWRVTKLSYVANGFNGDRGSNYPSGEDFVDEGIPFISTSDLINGKVLVNNVSRITEDRYSLLGGLKIYFGDIIYCLRGSVGKNGICEFNEGTIASSLMGIRCTSVNPYYLLLLLNSSIESQQRANYTTGSVSANLSAENVMSYKFAFPCEKEQLEISEKLKKVFEDFDQLIAKAESAIQLMQERRTALISSAVTGKIDIRNWQNLNNNEANTEFGA